MLPKFKYILDYFRKAYQVPDDVEIGYGTDDRIINIFDSQTSYFDELIPYNPDWVIWDEWQGIRLPFLFPAAPATDLISFENDRCFIRHDLLASAFFLLSGWQENVYMNTYSALRYPFEDSLQKKLGITALPVVNYYFEILKSAVERSYNLELTVKAWGDHPYAICLTHDIDNCTTGWKMDSMARIRKGQFAGALRLLAQRLGGLDPWFNFSEIISLEKKYQANSSFYFIARKGKVWQNSRFSRFEGCQGISRAALPQKIDSYFRFSPLARWQGYRTVEGNADYRLSDPSISAAMVTIESVGSEVGIHGSFGSHLDSDYFAEELRRFSTTVDGGRFHFLYFDITTTPAMLQSAGLQYDSTLGFAEQPGFRNSIAWPFPMYDFKNDRPLQLLQIPLVLMDTTLRSYIKMPFDEIPALLEELLAETGRFNGCMTVLWHNPYFTEDKFAGWREIYEMILQKGANSGALMCSGEQIIQSWKSHTIANR